MPHGPIDIDATLQVLEADLADKMSSRNYWYGELAGIETRIKDLEDYIKRLKVAKALFEGIPEDEIPPEEEAPPESP